MKGRRTTYVNADKSIHCSLTCETCKTHTLFSTRRHKDKRRNLCFRWGYC